MKTLSIFVLLSTLMACNTQQKGEYAAIESEPRYGSARVVPQEHPGKQLMENNCYLCHNPKASEENMVAPPMVAVKLHYLSEDSSKETFIEEMVSFLKDPSREKSKMQGAIKKFGLMPYQFYPEKTIRQIADYLYDYPVEEPQWFEGHYAEMHGERPKRARKMHRGNKLGKAEAKSPTQPSLEARGMEMAKTTKQALGKNLMGQIQKNGVIAALDFCNIQAMPLTDSMSVLHHAHIKRVSDKPRNPKNKANPVEAVHIETFKKQLEAGEEPTPIVTTFGEKATFYYPIVTNTMCLKCHGTADKELQYPTLEKIRQYYPQDKATGYKENQVRGIWSIEFSQ